MRTFLRNKKIMILVPHEDDELNITGGLLCSDYFDFENVYIVYMTNGDYVCNYKRRIKEARLVSKKIGVPLDNIIFMGYSDQYSRGDNHIYMTNDSDCFVSKKGCRETFMIDNGEYHYLRYGEHASFNYESLLNDYVDLLNQYKPDVLFCIDFDSHCDHRANSLIFEKSLGIVLNLDKEYNPLVYKCFAYPNAYMGVADFYNVNILSTKFKTEDHSICEMMNPYYSWDERVRFGVDNNKLFINNKLYRLLRTYRSQVIVRKAPAIINSDVICWQRRTDNLIREASVSASSGDTKFLNDFLLFDVSNIMHGNTEQPKLKECSWRPDSSDKEKMLKFKFKKKRTINEIVIYQECNTIDRIEEINIEYGKTSIIKKLDGLKTSIALENIETAEIKIRISKFSGNNFGISEIEIFEQHKRTKKMYEVEINDCFGINKIYCKKLINLDVYEYDGFVYRKLSKEEYEVKYNKNNVEVRVNNKLIKQVKIIRNPLIISANSMICMVNKITLGIDLFILKCFNKVDRLLGKM